MSIKNRAQSSIEYSVVILAVISGIILMRPYIIRGVNAHMKTLEESVQDSISDPLIQANILLSPICGDTICDATENDPTSPTYCCVDCGSCGDGRCCSETGEDIESGGTTACPKDCGKCNDGVCCNEANPLTVRCKETDVNCCADCPIRTPPEQSGARCESSLIPPQPRQCCRCNNTDYPAICTNSTPGTIYARNECATDCQTAVCGNGICESGETVANCGDCFSCNPGGDPLFYDDVCHDVARGGSPYRELLGSGGTPGNCICDCHCGDGICMDGSPGHEVPAACAGRTGWPESRTNCPQDCENCPGNLGARCVSRCHTLAITPSNECRDAQGNCSVFTTQSECQSPCGWTAGCTGDETIQCSTFNTSESCALHSGCSWDSTVGNSCVPFNSSCNGYINQTECSSNHCSWQSAAGICMGIWGWCGGHHSQEGCTSSGCSWTPTPLGGLCLGYVLPPAPACGTRNRTSCGPDCTWIDSGYCEITPCNYSTQTECTNHDCNWQSGSCLGTTQIPCSYGTPELCNVVSGCSWSGTCSGNYVGICSDSYSYSSCRPPVANYWGGCYPGAGAPACDQFTDPATCASLGSGPGGCVWLPCVRCDNVPMSLCQEVGCYEVVDCECCDYAGHPYYWNQTGTHCSATPGPTSCPSGGCS